MRAFARKQSGKQDIIDPRNGQVDSFCCEIQNHNYKSWNVLVLKLMINAPLFLLGN